MLEQSVTISVGVDTSPLREGLASLKREVDKLGGQTGVGYGAALQQGLEKTGKVIDEKARALSMAAKERSLEISAALDEGVTTTLGHLTSAFEEFARTGELNVKEMVGAILADLARLAAQTFLEDIGNDLLKTGLSFAASLFSAGVGGGKTPSLPTGKALGGAASFGKPYIVGEQGRELFVPESSGQIVPNGAMGGGNITFNIQATDVKSFERSESQIATMLNRMVRRGNRNL